MRRIVILNLVVCLLGQSAPSWAEPAAEESTPQQVAYGAGSVLGTLVYSPIKGSFCILGAIASGFTLPFAGPETAGKVVGTTCRGTWVITPNVLRDRERVDFIGRTPETAPKPSAR